MHDLNAPTVALLNFFPCRELHRALRSGRHPAFSWRHPGLCEQNLGEVIHPSPSLSSRAMPAKRAEMEGRFVWTELMPSFRRRSPNALCGNSSRLCGDANFEGRWHVVQSFELPGSRCSK